MIKKVFLIPLVLCLTILFGCVVDSDTRPQCNNEYVWVCNELPDTYFYWDEETYFFTGSLSYNDKIQDFAWTDSYRGYDICIYYPYVIENGGIFADDEYFISGIADYQKDFLTLEIKEDKLNIFNGEITTITFTPQKWEDFFKEEK